MKYKVDDDGVEALNTMASAITEAIEQVNTQTSGVQSAADEYQDTIGPHKASLDAVLSDIAESIKQASEPATSVAEKLNEVAEAYQEIIGNDRIKGANSGQNGVGTGSSASGASANPGSSAGGPARSNSMSGVRRIAGEHTSSQDAAATNPHYDHSGKTKEYNDNCQRCVPAYEARRRGYDVTAKPIPANDDLSVNGNWTAIYQGAHPISCNGSGYADAVKHIGSFGESARAEVKVLWEGGEHGHVFAAEVIGGRVHFIDPQSNRADCSGYFDDVQWGSVEVLRIDNLEFSDRIKDCLKEK